MASIFICGDAAQEAMLGAVAATLRDDGHTIIRGPAAAGGGRKVYDENERRALIEPADVAVFTNRHDVSRALLAGAPRLRGICYPNTGVESLDLDAATELGIIVGHGRIRGNAVGMAESTVLLILALLYGLPRSSALMANGGWSRPRHPVRSLDGKTIGLIGFGRIAAEVAARLMPFNVRILTASPRARQQDLPTGVTKVDLATLLRQSDVVSVLTGLTPETEGMLGAAEFALMKNDALIVNTGRGAVIDEPAMIDALREKRIGGAALDTFTVEPLPADHPLRSLDNVILTPHCIGHTDESMAEFGPALAENIRRIVAGELPLYCKNPQAEGAWRARVLG